MVLVPAEQQLGLQALELQAEPLVERLGALELRLGALLVELQAEPQEATQLARVLERVLALALALALMLVPMLILETVLVLLMLVPVLLPVLVLMLILVLLVLVPVLMLVQVLVQVLVLLLVLVLVLPQEEVVVEEADAVVVGSSKTTAEPFLSRHESIDTSLFFHLGKLYLGTACMLVSFLGIWEFAGNWM